MQFLCKFFVVSCNSTLWSEYCTHAGLCGNLVCLPLHCVFRCYNVSMLQCFDARCSEAWISACPMQVPITLYFMTHAYFNLYHTISNLLIRRTRHALSHRGPIAQGSAEALVVFLLSYATAYGETLTIAHFPYYTFKDKSAMYRTGSLFYAIYFFVSFPMFYRLDEDTKAKPYSMWRIVVDSLAAGMLVTCLLDFWRISFGGIISEDAVARQSRILPWIASPAV